MVFNAHQRHEGRRCLPKGTRDRNQLVLKHMGLAHCVATRQQQRGPEEHDDLLQEARLGLIQGMDNWDPSRGFRPSSYLMSRANGQVLHYRRDRSRMVRIPWRLQDLYVSGQRLQQERMQKGLPLLDDSSIAERLRVTLQRWLDATAAEVSKKIMPIGNLDLETTPCCPKPDAQDGVAARRSAFVSPTTANVVEATFDRRSWSSRPCSVPSAQPTASEANASKRD